LVLFQESVEGIIKRYDASVPMLGAVNRSNVTCYLDALLFAMFARMDNFEPILCTTLEDEPKRRLSTLIRLWVNMLRTGKLIPIDIVGSKHVYTLHLLTRNTDPAFARSPCCVWLAGSRQTCATGYLRSVQLYHRGPKITTSHVENGSIPHRHRGGSR
jgi:hypothetical protein